MSRDFAYLAGGKLHLKLGDAPARAVESRFGEQVRARAIEMQKRVEWKTQGTGAQFMRGGVLWGVGGQDAAEMRIAITGVSKGCTDGELTYTLETPEVSGIFVLRDGGQVEQRLYHTADFRVGQVSAGPDRLAFVVRQKGGGSSIAVMNADGSAFAEVTQGDTIDLAPRWLPQSQRELVFQSAGIGRNQAGMWMDQAPFTVQKLDVESGELTTLAEEAGSDLLSPQLAGDGTLYYIKRPYRSLHPKISPWRAALDFVLMPFRLLFAIFQYLNFFTARYTGKTLTTAGDVRQRQADIHQMMIWGNLRAAEQDARKRPEEAASLVPDSWKLVRQAGGSVEVIASGVLSFDLLADGSVIYTNGSAICRLADGKSEQIVKDSLIQQVVAIG